MDLAEVLEMRAGGKRKSLISGGGAEVNGFSASVDAHAKVDAAARDSLVILDEARQLFSRAIKGTLDNRTTYLRQRAERGEARCSKLPPFVGVFLFFRQGAAWQTGAIGKTDAVWAPTIFDAAQPTVYGEGEALVYRIVLAQPPLADVELTNPDEVEGCVAVVLRGGGSFDKKIEHAAHAGAVAVLVVNNDQTCPDAVRPMSGRGGTWRAPIPAMMISRRDGARLLRQIQDFDAGEDAGDGHMSEISVEACFMRSRHLT